MAKVTLIAHTDMPEKIVAAAAKLCYSPAEYRSYYGWSHRRKNILFCRNVVGNWA